VNPWLAYVLGVFSPILPALFILGLMLVIDHNTKKVEQEKPIPKATVNRGVYVVVKPRAIELYSAQRN